MYSTKTQKLLIKLTLFTVLLCFWGCGKQAPPLAPELLSPKSVQKLEVVGETGGIRFKWEAPENDLRSKELTSLNGYKIYRKTLTSPADVTNDDVPFELVASVEDTHIAIRDKLREEARSKGLPASRIKSDAALMRFEILDSGVTAGVMYLYQIVPFNQNDVEGEITQLIRVAFRGDGSEIRVMPYSSIDQETFLARYE